MKPKFANLLLAASIVVSFSAQASAALIVKANNADALNLTTSWTGGVVPGAADTAVWDATIIANQTVALGADLSWSGIDMTNVGGDITFSAANTLTLGTAGFTSAVNKWIFFNPAIALGAAQTWTTPNNLFCYGVVSGAPALTKAGPAILTLGGANTISGGINVTAGQLTTKNGTGLGAVTNVLTLGNGTTYRYERTTANATTFVGNPITVSPASSVTITGDNAANGYSGFISGDAASTVTIGATGALTQVSFDRKLNEQQFLNFLGTVKIFDGGSIRFSASSALNNGGASALFDTSLTGNIATRNGGTVNLGALTGTGSVTGATGATGTAIFSVGAKGIASTFGGVMNDGNLTDRKAALTKVGAEKLTLTGANTYTGATTVSVGTLEIGDGGTTGSIGATTVGVAASANLNFNPGSAQLQTVSGIVSGAGNVLKKGSGRTTLTGVNTFTVGPVIEAGTLAVNADSGLGAVANSVSFTTGSGKLASDAAGLVTARAISVATGATGGFSAIDATDSIEVTGVVSGNGALEIGGLGLVRLAAANTYLGNTTVTSGTLDVGGVGSTSTGSVSVTGGTLAGTGTISGAVSTSSGAGIKPGAITTTTSSTGTLNTGALTLAGGSTLYTEFTNATTYDKVVVTGNVLTSGASLANPVLVDLRLENSVAKWTDLGTFNLIQYSGSFTGIVNDLFKVSPGSTQAGLTYTFTAVGGFIKVTITGAAPSQWNVDTNGNWSLAGNWNAGGVPNAIGASAKFGTIITLPRTVTVDSAKTVGAIQFNNLNQYTIGGASILTLDATGAGPAGIEILLGSHTISAPLTLTDSIDLSLASVADTLTLSGNITGAGGINNPTAGAVVLAGTNTFAGAVNFSGGSLTFGNGSLGAGALTLANTTLLWGSGNVQDISTKVVTIGGTAVTLDTNSNNVSLANAIGNSGTGNFIKAGAGKLTFAANATYTGTTTISGGILQLGAGGSTGLVSGTITNNAELDVNLAAASTFSSLVTGTGSFVHVGSGVLTLAAQNTFTGTTSVSSATGTLILSDALNLQNSTLNYGTAGGALSFGTLTAATLGGLSGDKNLALANTTPAAVTLTIGNNSQATVYSGILSGAGSLTKFGTAVSTLSGMNSYLGATLVSAGTLDLATGGAINGSTLTVNGSGKMLISGGTFGATTGALVVGSGGLQVDSGTVTFSGAIAADGSSGSTNSALIKVTGGILTVPSIALGRTGQNVTAEPALAAADTNLYITGGAVNVTGNLDVGTFSNQPNSTVITRIDGGTLTVGGALTVGLNNTGRWSILDINGGDLSSTNAVSGIVLGGASAGKSAFLVRLGTATAERIQLGQGTLDGAGLIKISGGALYVGTGGIVLGTTGAFFVPEIRLTGGILGAKGTWSSSMPVNLAGVATVKAADALGTPFDIALSGAVNGTGGLNKTGTGMLTLTGAVGIDSLLAHAGATVIGTGGVVTTSAFSGVGIAAGDIGTLTLKNTGAWTSNGDLNVGDTGTPLLAATGTLDIQDTSTLTIGATGGLYLGAAFFGGTDLATGTVNQTGGTVTHNNTAAGTFVVGGRNGALATGTYNLSAGTATSLGQVYVGGAGTGTLNISATGTFNANAGLLLGNNSNLSITSAGTVNLNGGTLGAASVSNGAGSGTFNFNGGALVASGASATFMTGLTAANVQAGGALINDGGFAVTIGQALLDGGGGGGLTKTGAGILTLSGTSGYTGLTSVQAGTLAYGVNNALSNGAVQVSGGTLDIATFTDTVGAVTLVSGAINGSGGVLTGTSYGVQAGSVSAILGGSAGLTKTTAGTVTLSGANIYAGNTTVTGGTLAISNAYLADAADVSIAVGASMTLSFGGTDTVHALTLDGVAKSPGTYGGTGSGATNIDSHFTGTGTLTVTTGPSGSAYGTWAGTFGAGFNASNNGATQDPDNDGISNALEFVLGGNPLTSNTSILPVKSLDATNFVFTFNRADASEAEITLKFQYGSTLTGWTDVAIGAASAGQVTVTENGTSPDTVVVTIPRTSAVGGKLFGRLQVVK